MEGRSYLERLLVEAGQKLIPIEISIELTHHCNFRCLHCYVPDFSATDLLTTERVLALLGELAEMGTLYLTLTGGELFLRRDWLQIARRSRDLGFYLRLFTNASLVDEDKADVIQALSCKVETSLYSMDEAVFERVTRRTGSFRSTLRGIELLCERGVEVLLKTPLMTLNHTGVERIFQYAESVGAEARLDPKIAAKKDGDLVTIQLRVGEEDLLPICRNGFLAWGVPGECEGNPDREGPLCAAGSRYANITASGDVMACNILPGGAGNIRDRSFREVWENSTWLKKVRSIHLRDLTICNTCEKFSYCGRCHAQALVEDGDIMGPSSWACRHAEVVEEWVKTHAASS
jgi:radical SAM protein with 4Fe4S-binding SPASM domain